MGEVDDLVVDCKLLAVVRDDEHTDRARATGESILQAGPQVPLLNDLEALLDLTGLGHSDELTVVANINETVLLEDGAEQRVEDNRGGGVRDNTRFLMELFGEEVNTEVTVLASLCRGGDADDLAGTVLKDHEITDADVMARDGERSGLRSVDRGDGLRLVRWVLLGLVG